MANAAVKNRLKRNAQLIQRFAAFLACANFLFIATRGWRGSLTFQSTVLEWALLLAPSAGPFLFMFAMSRPTYNSTGQPIDGGEDISVGYYEHLHDLLYYTCFVQCCVAFSSVAWILMIAIPGTLTYHAVVRFVAAAPENVTSTEDEEPAFAGSRKERRAQERALAREGRRR